MKIAYLILAHTDPEMLKIQCKSLADYSDVYIHINSKSDIKKFIEAINDIENCDNIYFTKERVKVHWGGFSIVNATMKLLEMALNNEKYDRFVLLTGQDYPIKDSSFISDFFNDNKDQNFIACKLLETNEFSQHIQCRDIPVLSKMVSFLIRMVPNFSLLKRKPKRIINNKEYKIYGIAPKWAITYECAKYILEFYKNNTEFNNWFKLSHAPDDFYVSTIVMNSKFNTKVNNTIDLFYIKWLPNNQGAKVLDEYDFEELKNSNALFAKKFTSTKSCKLIGVINND